MSFSKAHIISELQKQILPLQGYKHVVQTTAGDAGLGRIKYAFPNASFPIGAVHEFFCSQSEDAAATSGFIAGILSSLLKSNGVSLWLSSAQLIFPPSLQLFGIEPDRIIFIDSIKEKEKLWVMEEALKCEGLSAVIGEIQDMSFTGSRRLQLAVEKSSVTGFIIRENPKNMATACVTRWRVKPLPGISTDGLPGVSFPRWNVELLKVRNGKPGAWQLEWREGRFQHEYKLAAIDKQQQRRAG